MLTLSKHDAALVEVVRTAIRSAMAAADAPVAVAKRITVEAVRQRNKGRAAAIRRHPFLGLCEQGRGELLRHDAVLDEIEPEKGYAGKVRWVCHKANNSGKRSCGVC